MMTRNDDALRATHNMHASEARHHLCNEQVAGADIAQDVHQANHGEQGVPLWLAVHKVVQQIWVAGHEADRVYQSLHSM